MKIRTIALVCMLALVAAFATGCASDVYGDWVDADGIVYRFGTNSVNIDGEDYYYIAKDGQIQIQFTTDLFGGESSFVMEGTYEKHGNNLIIALGQSTVWDLTRY